MNSLFSGTQGDSLNTDGGEFGRGKFWKKWLMTVSWLEDTDFLFSLQVVVEEAEDEDLKAHFLQVLIGLILYKWWNDSWVTKHVSMTRFFVVWKNGFQLDVVTFSPLW